MQNTPKWVEELAALRKILMKTGLDVAIKWGAEVFEYEGKKVVSYGGFKDYFSLWFYNGVFLSDPDKVLLNAQEGKTKALRQWRFTSMAEIDEGRILAYMAEAIQNEKEGKVWQPEKNPMPDIPEELGLAFHENKALHTAFDQLAPYKQRDYIEHIGGAKQEKTRISRLEKAIPLILAGLGLNDKYSK